MVIKLKGYDMYLDAVDLPLYESRVWHISDTGYVVWRGIEGGIKKTLRLHREIAKHGPNECERGKR